MRPTREATDLEFWTSSQTYWKEQAEFWFLQTASSADPTWTAECERREQRARDRLFAAELAHQEARGEIVVYSGRPNPTWMAA